MTIRLLTRTEIRNIAKELDFRPRKALGQNFVHDSNMLRRIVSSSGITRSDHVLEVGPGMGSLTLALLDRGVAVTAVHVTTQTGEVSAAVRDIRTQGTTLLGVRAVIAESFERIHRSNLVGMGVLPLQFSDGVPRKKFKP